MTLEGANNTMKRRGKKLIGEVSILERLQNIRAMLLEVRESLGEGSSVEYEAPIEAVTELISDVEKEAKAHVVEVATKIEPVAEPVAPVAEPTAPVVEPAAPAAETAEVESPRRGRPRKSGDAQEGDAQPVARRRTSKKKEDNQELFPFYEQSLF
jgi:hypothetical protein